MSGTNLTMRGGIMSLSARTETDVGTCVYLLYSKARGCVYVKLKPRSSYQHTMQLSSPLVPADQLLSFPTTDRHLLLSKHGSGA